MAEYTIDTDANVFVIDINHPHPWICRDDSGNFWTVFKNLSNNIEIHKSEDKGVTWANKKTLTDTDFTGTPFPIDSFQIINLDGQDKVYITLSKDDDLYSYMIDTTTDIGSVDLDGVDIQRPNATRIEVRWDNSSSLLKVFYGDTSYNQFCHRTINLTGGVSGVTNTNLNYGQGRAKGACFDSSGNIFINTPGASSGSYNSIQKAGTTTYKYLFENNIMYDFANILCDHQDKIVLGCVYSNGLHIFKLSNNLSTIEIDDATYALGFTPLACFMTIDGVNDIHFVYTNPTDNEAYSIKYDISASSYGSPIKISSDNDGLLVCPELKPPLNDTELLVTYQSIS